LTQELYSQKERLMTDKDTTEDTTKDDEFDFEAALKANEDKAKKKVEDRLKNNKKVLRDYSIK